MSEPAKGAKRPANSQQVLHIFKQVFHFFVFFFNIFLNLMRSASHPPSVTLRRVLQVCAGCGFLERKGVVMEQVEWLSVVEREIVKV